MKWYIDSLTHILKCALLQAQFCAPLSFFTNLVLYLQLQKIIISISSLKYIDPRTFDGLTRLRKLEIRSHSLQNTPDLSSVGRTLQIFRLSNFGGAYENINLKSMVSLRGFVMEESGLIRVPEDIRYVAASLCVLDLRNNKISTLGNMHDIPFPSLREVWLQFNNICHLRPKLLRLPILQSFSIANNKITELPNLSSCVWGMETEHAKFALFVPANNPFTAMDQWCGWENQYAALGMKFIFDDWCWRLR